MTPALKEQAIRLEKRIACETSEIILFRYEIGTLVYEILSNQDTYGCNSVAQLSTYLGMKPDLLYSMRDFAQAYKKNEVKKLAKCTMSNGSPICFGHLVLLVKISDMKKRRVLMNRVLSESLSTNQLATEIAAALGPKISRGGGRKPAKPSSPRSAYQQMASQARTVNNRLTQVWTNVFDEVDEIEPDKLDKHLLSGLDAASSEFETLGHQIKDARARLKQNRSRIVDVLAERQSMQATPKTECIDDDEEEDVFG